MVSLAEEPDSSSPSSEAVARASGRERLLRLAPLADEIFAGLVVVRPSPARGTAARWRAVPVAVAAAAAAAGRADHAVAVAARVAIVASFIDSRLPRSRSRERDDDV